jgi:predicted DNA-binding transcriptional regulator YafY
MVPWTHEVEVELPGETLTMRVESLDYMARVLAGLDCEFRVVRPDALRDAVKRLSDLLDRAAASTPPC